MFITVNGLNDADSNNCDLIIHWMADGKTHKTNIKFIVYAGSPDMFMTVNGKTIAALDRNDKILTVAFEK